MSFMKVAYLLDVPFTCCQFKDVLDGMKKRIDDRSRGHIAITNTETLYHAVRDTELKRFIQFADYSCCDGTAVSVAGRLFGQKIPRLHGPDLMLKACEYGVKQEWRHFFYGGKEGVPELLSKKLRLRFPDLQIVGTYSPAFRPIGFKENENIIQKINDTKPDILWIGLGLLKQWKWIFDHKELIMVPWMVGIGAAFDFYAETITRAPKIFRDVGLEWLYRVTFEPRMLKRNFMSFIVIMQVILHKLKENQ